MGKSLKFLGGLLAVMVIGTVGLVVYLQSIDFNEYKGLIAEQVKNATGRDLAIEGDINLALSMTPSLAVDGIRFSNASWGSKPDMVGLRRFEAEVQIMPLLSGNVVVDRIVLIAPEILIETDAKGNGNWIMKPADAGDEDKKADDSGPGKLPQVHTVLIRDALFTYKDGVAKTEQVIKLQELEIFADGLNAPLNLRLAGNYNGNDVNVTGRLDSAQALANGGAFDIDLKAMVADAVATIKGQIADPAAAKGIDLAITAKGSDIAKVAAVAGVALHKIGPYDIALTVKDAAGGYAIKPLTAKIGGSDLTGDATIALGGKPTVRATLKSTLFDLADVLPPPAPAAKAEPAPKGAKIFPADPLPLDGLKAVNATISYGADKFVAQQIALEGLKLGLKLKDGVLSVDPLSANIAQGSLASKVVLNGAKKVPALNAKVTMSKINVGALLEQLDMTDLMSGGLLDTDITLSGAGPSVAAIMGTLNGKIKAVMGESKVNNDKLDLIGADVALSLYNKMNPFAEKDTHTVISCGVVLFNVKDGVMTTDKGIALETARMNVISSGTVNLKSEKLDLKVGTEPREGIGLGVGNLAAAVKLGGTLAEPGMEVDALEAGKTALKIGGAVATGGLSVLAEGLTDRATADENPCLTALGQKAPAKKKTTTKSTTTAPAKTDAPVKEQAVDKVKDLLGGAKSLFGN